MGVSCRKPFELDAREFSSHQSHYDTRSEGRGDGSGDRIERDTDFLESQTLSDMYGDLQGVIFPADMFPQTTRFRDCDGSDDGGSSRKCGDGDMGAKEEENQPRLYGRLEHDLERAPDCGNVKGENERERVDTWRKEGEAKRETEVGYVKDLEGGSDMRGEEDRSTETIVETEKGGIYTNTLMTHSKNQELVIETLHKRLTKTSEISHLKFKTSLRYEPIIPTMYQRAAAYGHTYTHV